MSDAVSTISSVVRFRVQAWMSPTSWSARSLLSTAMNRDSSCCHSGRPMSAQKSSHCWPVMTKNPTQPSAVGSMPGTGTPRLVWKGRPAIELNVTGYMPCSRWVVSSIETSISSPTPVWRIRPSTPSRLTAATEPANQ